MNTKQRIARTVGRVALSPFSFLKGRTVADMVYRKGLEMVIEAGTPYALDTAQQPNRSSQKYFRPSTAFNTRFDELAKTIKAVGASNLLDIGCAEGYMISRAANELGTFGIGLELDKQRIRTGNAYRELAGDHHYAIVPASAGPDLLKRLPVFDVVVCFSVLHHVIRYDGMDAAMEFLVSIRKITGQRFLFDMGSPEETANDPEWAIALAFMKGDEVNKIRELLESAGFVNVTHVGNTPGFVQTAVRPLFVCSAPDPT